VNYVRLPAQRFPDAIFVNAGINYDTSLGGAGRLDAIVALEPDAVTVLIGTNDINNTLSDRNAKACEKWRLSQTLDAELFAETLQSIVARLRARKVAGGNSRISAFRARSKPQLDISGAWPPPHHRHHPPEHSRCEHRRRPYRGATSPRGASLTYSESYNPIASEVKEMKMAAVGSTLGAGRLTSRGMAVVAVATSLAAIGGCGTTQHESRNTPVPPAVATTPTPSRPTLSATARATAALGAGGIQAADLPGIGLIGAPLTSLDQPTLATLCGAASRSALTSDKLRLARKQLVWRAGATAFVSEERIVYKQDGVQAAVQDFQHAATSICPDQIGIRPAPSSAKLPAGSLLIWSKDAAQRSAFMNTYAVPISKQLLVVLWSNWTAPAEQPTVQAALANASKVLVQREQPTLRALAAETP
jgi:hypothetical protein